MFMADNDMKVENNIIDSYDIPIVNDDYNHINNLFEQQSFVGRTTGKIYTPEIVKNVLDKIYKNSKPIENTIDLTAESNDESATLG